MKFNKILAFAALVLLFNTGCTDDDDQENQRTPSDNSPTCSCETEECTNCRVVVRSSCETSEKFPGGILVTESKTNGVFNGSSIKKSSTERANCKNDTTCVTKSDTEAACE